VARVCPRESAARDFQFAFIRGQISCLSPCLRASVVGVCCKLLPPKETHASRPEHVPADKAQTGKSKTRLYGAACSNTAGGDYVIQVSFNPKVGRHLGPRHVDGNAWLCTPRGEKFRLHLGGDFQKDLKLDTNGKTASFYMNSYNLKNQFTGNTRPSLELRGKWMNADLVLDDQGSIARNFEPDGTLYNGHSPSRPYMKEVVPVTLHEGSNSEFEAACKAVKGKRQVKE
jgi:hypothetical protein